MENREFVLNTEENDRVTEAYKTVERLKDWPGDRVPRVVFDHLVETTEFLLDIYEKLEPVAESSRRPDN